jgi:hypothetical protein
MLVFIRHNKTKDELVQFKFLFLFNNKLPTIFILEAVQRGASDGSTVNEIEDTIKVWLKHSPHRLKLEQKRHNVQEAE